MYITMFLLRSLRLLLNTKNVLTKPKTELIFFSFLQRKKRQPRTKAHLMR